VAFSLDGSTSSVLSVGLVADGQGAARFQLTVQGGGAASRTAVLADAAVVSTLWYQLTASVLPGQHVAELAVASYDQFFAPANQGVVQASWDNSFNPVAATGKLRLGSAQPTSAAPIVPLNPWSGDVDEVYAIRGAQPSANNAPGPDVNKWAQAIRPYAGNPSPCS
jgi:hypothetical protein